jgi:hypothetical protein
MRWMFVATVAMTKLVAMSAMTQVNITKLYNNFVVNAVINDITYQEIVSIPISYSLSTQIMVALIDLSID